MSSKVNTGGKFLVAAACAASLAQIPLASISAYSQDYAPNFATTLSISGTDYILDSIATSDGGVIVVGGGEIHSAKDSAIIAKYSADGTKVWQMDLGGQSESYATKVISLSNGNYLVSATIDGENRLVEVSPSGVEVGNSKINQELTGIADTTASSDSVISIVGVDGSDSIYILHKGESEATEGYSVTMAVNIQDNVPIHTIKEYGNEGYVAIGFDENQNKSIIYTANTKGNYPKIRAIQSEGFHINDVIPNDDNFIVVGTKDGKMHIAKIDSEGTIINDNEYTIDGENTSGATSQLTSVETMPSGEIVAVGSSNYSSTSVFTPKGGQDGVIARFDGSLSPISIREYAGNEYDALNTVTVDGENFYVGGTSRSTDMGIDYVGNELYSIISHFEYGTNADVTFHIDGDLPEGVDAPENGEYHWDKDGNSDLPIPANTDDAIFSGWYTDQDMENALGDQTPSSDLDLYGAYTLVGHDLVDDNIDTMCETVDNKLVCTAPEGYEVNTGETTDPIIPQVPSGDYTGLTGKWISDDESIATVDQRGRVTGISEGTTTIRYILLNEEGNVVYEYVMSFTVKAATNPDTVDILPLVLVVSAFSFASFSLVATRVFKRR